MQGEKRTKSQDEIKEQDSTTEEISSKKKEKGKEGGFACGCWMKIPRENLLDHFQETRKESSPRYQEYSVAKMLSYCFSRGKHLHGRK